MDAHSVDEVITMLRNFKNSNVVDQKMVYRTILHSRDAMKEAGVSAVITHSCEMVLPLALTESFTDIFTSPSSSRCVNPRRG